MVYLKTLNTNNIISNNLSEITSKKEINNNNNLPFLILFVSVF